MSPENNITFKRIFSGFRLLDYSSITYLLCHLEQVSYLGSLICKLEETPRATGRINGINLLRVLKLLLSIGPDTQ